MQRFGGQYDNIDVMLIVPVTQQVDKVGLPSSPTRRKCINDYIQVYLLRRSVGIFDYLDNELRSGQPPFQAPIYRP